MRRRKKTLIRRNEFLCFLFKKLKNVKESTKDIVENGVTYEWCHGGRETTVMHLSTLGWFFGDFIMVNLTLVDEKGYRKYFCILFHAHVAICKHPRIVLWKVFQSPVSWMINEPMMNWRIEVACVNECKRRSHLFERVSYLFIMFNPYHIFSMQKKE